MAVAHKKMQITIGRKVPTRFAPSRAVATINTYICDKFPFHMPTNTDTLVIERSISLIILNNTNREYKAC